MTVPLARAIAFEKALTSSRGLVERFLHAAKQGPLVNVATDGETYGHHFKFGDLGLAHALGVEAKQAGFWITNYGEYLDRQPPETVVEIENGAEGEGSSWSCAHGVGRWTRDCGCHTGGEPGWNQSWREPLRVALNFLRDDTAVKFENSAGELLRDPWAARNDYIAVLLNPKSARADFRAETCESGVGPGNAGTRFPVTRNATQRFAHVYELRLVLRGSRRYRDDSGFALRGSRPGFAKTN